MRKPLSLLSAVAVIAAGIAVAAPAQADTRWGYFGSSGGTQIQALGTTIKSDLTAQSSLSGTQVPRSAENGIAKVAVGGLLKVGAVTTSEDAVKFGTGVKITSKANTAGVNLLGGAIQVGAVETTTFAQANGTNVAGGSNTIFVNLKIGGKALPITVPKNFGVTIPGLAEVTLNQSKVTDTGSTYINEGAAVRITLLRAYGGAKAGASIVLNPTQAGVLVAGDLDAAKVGGIAYGSYAQITAGSDIKVLLGPSAATGIAPEGTAGRTIGNSTLSANVPGLLSLGVISTEANALTITGYSDVKDSAKIAKLNLLGGLIKADAIQATSHLRKTDAGITSDRDLQFINLSVGGTKIPLNVEPNTKIDLLGIGTLVINRQIVTAKSSWVVGVDLTLSTAKYGLPVGAEVQIATAAVWVY